MAGPSAGGGGGGALVCFEDAEGLPFPTAGAQASTDDL